MYKDKYKKYKSKYLKLKLKGGQENNEENKENDNKEKAKKVCDSRKFCGKKTKEKIPYEEIESLEDLRFRSSGEFDWSDFEYPLRAYFAEEGEWNYGGLINKQVDPVDAKELLDVTKFDKVFYFREGNNDDISWIFLIQHNNGYYVFFQAMCDYTGFDCQGCGEILYDKDPKDMWEMALTDALRMLITYNQRIWFEKDQMTS